MFVLFSAWYLQTLLMKIELHSIGVLNIKEGQTTQWLKEKGQKDKQRSTKHTHKTKD
jgi:hypothetical protein